jgi:hypothetical protein
MKTDRPRYGQNAQLLKFLGIRMKRNIMEPTDTIKKIREFEKNRWTRVTDLGLLMLITAYNEAPNISIAQLSNLMNKGYLMYSKANYLEYIRPKNTQKKSVFIRRLKGRMLKFNRVLREFITNYKLLREGSELRKKYDPIVDELSRNIFGRTGVLSNVKEDDGEEEDMNATVEFKKETTEDKKNKKKSIVHEKKFKKVEYKYSGQPLTEKQINSRLHFINIARERIVNSALSLTDRGYYKNRHDSMTTEKTKKNLVNHVNSIFKDSPNLRAHYLDVIQNKFTNFKYVDKDLTEKEYLLTELAEDILQKEYDYVVRLRRMNELVTHLEDKFGEKINTGNLLKALSVFEGLNSIDIKYKNMNYMNSVNRPIEGSPVTVFFENVKETFEKEMNLLKGAKEVKYNESKLDSIDDVYATRKDLIEDYTNKVLLYQKAQSKTRDSAPQFRHSQHEMTQVSCCR